MSANHWVLVVVNIILFVLWRQTDANRQEIKLLLVESKYRAEIIKNELILLERMMRASGSLPKGWDEDYEEEE